MQVHRRRSTLFGGLLAGVLSMGLMTGCASSADYPLALATKLQTSVQLVTQLASDGEYQAALTALQHLRRDLAAAREEGTVGADRVADIEAAIAAVSKDLKTKIGDEMVPDKKHTSSPEEETPQAPQPLPEAPVNPVPAPEVPAPAPAPVPAPEESQPSTPTPTPTPTTEEPTPSLTPTPTPEPEPTTSVPTAPSSSTPIESGSVPPTGSPASVGPQPPTEGQSAGTSTGSGTTTP